jgi:hypothetical protein
MRAAMARSAACRNEIDLPQSFSEIAGQNVT